MEDQIEAVTPEQAPVVLSTVDAIEPTLTTEEVETHTLSKWCHKVSELLGIHTPEDYTK